MKKLEIIVGVLVGIVCLGFAVLYWTTPAGSLPAYLPGFIAGSGEIHVKHGIAALVVALGAFTFSWFSSGKKKQG
jgi:amino acid permease